MKLMEVIRKCLPVILAAGVVAGCAASGPAPQPVVADTRPASQDAGLSEGFDIGELPAQDLEPGECGLFLFTARPTPRFVFFSNAAKATALMKLDGEFVTLARTQTAGEVFDQQYSEQTFVAPAQGLEAKLSLRRGRETLGGSQIDGGSVRLSRENGWNMVIPVGGATACETR